MEFTLISSQLTAFANFSLEDAEKFVKSFNDNCEKIAIQLNENQSNAPWFQIKEKNKLFAIDIWKGRIDCFFSVFEEKIFFDFVNFLKKFQNLGSITRIAINYVDFVRDHDGLIKSKVEKYFQFFEIFGETQEIAFRLNSQKELNDLKFNFISNWRNDVVQNSQTFEQAKCMMFHYDINNIPTENIAIERIPEYFELMKQELEKIIQKRKEILE